MCREGRLALGWSQQRLAASMGVARSYVAAIELGRANPSLEVIARLAGALGFDLELLIRPPIVFGDRRQHDAVHARCSGYVDRRLRASGWETAREVEIVDGRWRGWIDLLAYDRRSRTLLVIEIKTRIDDIGAIERQTGWYRRVARQVARSRGWDVGSICTWLLVLATSENDAVLSANRELLGLAFPGRAAEMVATLTDPARSMARRSIAAIDPRSRRRDWLSSTRIDGRRRHAPYRDCRDAALRMDGRSHRQ
jgi:transcriptional regulator with XRE-family HTH domain